MVQDCEILYRSVSVEHKHCVKDENTGQWVLSSQAFSDAALQPSVDRATLCDYNPVYTRRAPKDGVVSVVVVDVRAIKSVVQNDEAGNPKHTHAVDVEEDPIIGHAFLADNPAHALIKTNPVLQNKKVFRRLLESLKCLAVVRGWELEPQD